MVLTDKKYKIYLLLIFSGLLTGFTVIFPQIGIVQWLSLIPMAIVLLRQGSDRSVGYGRIYIYGAVYFYIYYLVTLNWFLYMYPLGFIDGMTKGAALLIVCLAWLGLPLLQAALGGCVFMLAAFLFRFSPFERIPMLRPLLAASLWAVFEWIQTLFLWGMPSARLPMGQTEMLVGIQTASLFGSYFITFILVAVNFFGAYALISFFERKEGKWRKELRSAVIAMASIMIFNYGVGTAIWFTSAPSDGDTVKVAAVQGNIDTSEMWGNETATRTFEVFKKYTEQAAEEGADIVVWSETALPYIVQEGNSVYKYISDIAVSCDITVITGIFTIDEEGNKYNSQVCFTPDGKMSDTVYEKIHLVPFGEFVPFKSLIETVAPPIAYLVTASGDLTEGESITVFDLPKANVGAVICYDAMYEDITLGGVREGAEFFAVSSNDAWFGNSSYLTMHNAQIKLRSVESGRYTVHSANTGISAVFTSRGEELSSVGVLESGIVCENIVLRQNRTLYSYIGNFFVYLCLAFLLAGVACRIWLILSEKRIAKAAENANHS